MVDFNKLLAETKAKSTATPPPSPQPVSAATATTVPAVLLPLVVASPDPVVVDKQKLQEPLQATVDGPVGSTIEYPGLVDLSQKISSLDEALRTKHPAMDSLLQTIHRNLQKDPELVHMLKPEQTAILFVGLQQKTQTKIVDETVKSAKGGRSAGLKNIGLEDL